MTIQNMVMSCLTYSYLKAFCDSIKKKKPTNQQIISCIPNFKGSYLLIATWFLLASSAVRQMLGVQSTQLRSSFMTSTCSVMAPLLCAAHTAVPAKG